MLIYFQQPTKERWAACHCDEGGFPVLPVMCSNSETNKLIAAALRWNPNQLAQVPRKPNLEGRHPQPFDCKKRTRHRHKWSVQRPGLVRPQSRPQLRIWACGVWFENQYCGQRGMLLRPKDMMPSQQLDPRCRKMPLRIKFARPQNGFLIDILELRHAAEASSNRRPLKGSFNGGGEWWWTDYPSTFPGPWNDSFKQKDLETFFVDTGEGDDLIPNPLLTRDQRCLSLVAKTEKSGFLVWQAALFGSKLLIPWLRKYKGIPGIRSSIPNKVACHNKGHFSQF